MCGQFEPLKIRIIRTIYDLNDQNMKCYLELNIAHPDSKCAQFDQQSEFSRFFKNPSLWKYLKLLFDQIFRKTWAQYTMLKWIKYYIIVDSSGKMTLNDPIFLIERRHWTQNLDAKQMTLFRLVSIVESMVRYIQFSVLLWIVKRKNNYNNQ